MSLVAQVPFDRLVAAAGLDPMEQRRWRLRPLLPSYGLDERALALDGARIPHELAIEDTERLASILGTDTLVLHAMQGWRLGDQGVGDYLNATSASLRELFATVSEYVPLLHDGIAFRVRQDGDQTLLVCELDDDETPHPWFAEAVLGKVAVEVRRALGAGAERASLKIRFAHHAPAYESAYQDALGTPVEFACGHDALVVPTAALDLPFQSADPVLHRILRAHASEQLRTAVPRRSLLDQVREAIEAELADSSADQSAVARKLGISPATLRRRLEQRHGVRYCDLVCETQRRVTIEHLREPGLPIEQIGRRVGFGEKAAFHRAFKRWFGCTPGAYRRTQRLG